MDASLVDFLGVVLMDCFDWFQVQVLWQVWEPDHQPVW
jgi:hypothetical protein